MTHSEMIKEYRLAGALQRVKQKEISTIHVRGEKAPQSLYDELAELKARRGVVLNALVEFHAEQDEEEHGSLNYTQH